MDKPVEVADGVYAYPQDDGSWWVNTTGFVVGRRDIVAIDSCSTLRRTERFRDAIAAVADLPVTRLVNTHHHGDHTYGNALFAAVVIGHENCRTEALADRAREHAGAFWSPAPDWGDLPLDPPSVTFSHRLTLYVDDLRMELIHPGRPAHTKGDIVCWLPEQRVLFTGDLVFNGGTPLMMQGSVTGSLEALGFLRDFHAETLVPGHGIPTSPDILDLHERYYRFVLRSAEQARACGLTPLEAARELDLGEFTDLLDPERIVLNLHRAYADLAGEGEVDPRQAFADAIAYNGGRPLRCVA
ncbi:MBL fold metallo-hydrolase [Nocardia sp. R7R-8]|uniref:MBL fold metallo-hydrolase n=1 Tax=Nocardia sp. R7R-8 TaxID=3459304 RepID=UPI00403D87BF